MQAHARVCAENKSEEKKTNAYGNNFMVIMVRGTRLKDHIGRMGKRIEMIIARMIYHNIKV